MQNAVINKKKFKCENTKRDKYNKIEYGRVGLDSSHVVVVELCMLIMMRDLVNLYYRSCL
jgi:hypothetical protein